MSPNSKNPATMAAGRASESFCLATEDSDDGHCPLCNQAPILGIDIGVKGAIARLTPDGELFDVFDIPCLNDGPAGRRNVNGPLLAEIIAQSHASRAYIELVGVRPGEGAVGAFSFGRSRGVVEGVVAALGVPTTHTSPRIVEKGCRAPCGP